MKKEALQVQAILNGNFNPQMYSTVFLPHGGALCLHPASLWLLAAYKKVQRFLFNKDKEVL